MMNITAKEHDEQVSLFQWAGIAVFKFPELNCMFAIPNGGLRNPVVARKLKAEGVKSGVSDIFLSVARGGYHNLYNQIVLLIKLVSYYRPVLPCPPAPRSVSSGLSFPSTNSIL